MNTTAAFEDFAITIATRNRATLGFIATFSFNERHPLFGNIDDVFVPREPLRDAKAGSRIDMLQPALVT